MSSAAGASAAGAGASSSKGLSVLEVEEGVKRSEEYFGVSPVRFVDDVYNCASAYIKRGLDQMEEVLLEDRDTRENATLVEHGIARTQDQLTKSLDRNIDKFELYIVRNILSVPIHLDTAGIVEQACHETSGSHTQQEEDQLDEELGQLRRKIHQAEFVKKAMTEKMQELDQELQNFRMVASALEELDSKVAAQFKEHGVQGGFEDAVLEVMQKDPEMRALEKQYAALESMGQEEGAVHDDSENVDSNFVRCRKQLGAPTTRALDELALMLGAH